MRQDVGLWSWLAVWFFDQLCPPDGRGRRRPLDNPKYVAQLGDHRFGLDKHLLFFPWKMVARHGEAARFLLSKPVGQDSREQREWTGNLHNVSTSLVQLCGELYWDQRAEQLKRGALSTARSGNLRRFVQVSKQLDLTYDVHGMSPDALKELRPDEFAGWVESPSRVNDLEMAATR